ncbi:MAG TPA: methyltransferase domain-containing protein [Candidatus Eremiobacteraceae bacterium]
MPKTENSQWYVEQVADGELHSHALKQTLAQGRSHYQSYAIVESPLFGKMLVLDGDTQSAALDEHIYHESLVAPACAVAGTPRSALILGGGEGATLRELLRVPSMRRVVMVDIDGEVVEACRRLMPEWSAGAFEDPRTEFIVGDAKAYVERSSEKFDVVLSDLTEPLEDSPSYGLHTAAFYRATRARLAPGGAYAIQTSTAGPHNFALHARMIATLRAAWPAVAPYTAYVPAFDTAWGFALCADQLDVFGEIMWERADELARACGLRHYDAQTHRHAFNLPRYLRDAYAAEKRVFE